MKIRIAKKAGFCMGVRRAVNLVLKALNANQTPLYTYGPLIHNPQTLELLSRLGVRVIKRVDEEVPKGYCVIRAHGVPPKEKKALEERHFVIDGTCPRVQKVQALASRAVSQGKAVVIIGDREHAEVKGILGYCEGKGFVVSSFKDLESLPDLKDYVILSQTTQDEEVFEMLSQEILRRFPGGEVINTICNATEVRQREVKRLCSECEGILVIGGKFSANTNRLAQIARAEGKEAFLVESKEELPLKELEKFKTLGITAGASTPNWLINEIVDTLKSKFNPLYRIFRSFILLHFHEALIFLLLLSTLFFINPALLNTKSLYLLPFAFFFQLFRKNLTNFLQRERLRFYYSLKASFLERHKNFIYFFLGFTLILALLSGFLFNPRILSLPIIFTFLDFILINNPFFSLLDLLFFISLLLYLYPYWIETLLWVSLHLIIILFIWEIYKELLYQQSDGFLPKNFLILHFDLNEKTWFFLLKLLCILSFLPFLFISLKFEYFYLLFLILLPFYILILTLLEKRPLGQLLYLESLFVLPPFFLVLISLLIYFLVK